MRILVTIQSRREERSVELPDRSLGMDLLAALGLHPDANLLVRGDVPIPHDEPLVDGEAIHIIGVVSGGRI
jgi:sulfur carrier protein ThiS